MKPWGRVLVLVALVGAGAAALRLSGGTDYLTVDGVRALSEEVRALGWVGPAAYVALWVAACLFFVPGLPLTLLGAGVFGAWWGILWVTVGSNLGAVAAFLVARYTARPLVEQWAGRNPLAARIDQGVARYGWRMVLVTRLVPAFPFNLQNYAYGLSGIGLGTYASVTFVCMLPATVAYCLAGGALVSGQGSPSRSLAYLGAAAAAFALASLVPRWVRRRSEAAASLTEETESPPAA
ncbi:MAG: hypothetical protein Kow0092_27850 [Deferrisomatales bacterium]